MTKAVYGFRLNIISRQEQESQQEQLPNLTYVLF